MEQERKGSYTDKDNLVMCEQPIDVNDHIENGGTRETSFAGTESGLPSKKPAAKQKPKRWRKEYAALLTAFIILLLVIIILLAIIGADKTKDRVADLKKQAAQRDQKVQKLIGNIAFSETERKSLKNNITARVWNLESQVASIDQRLQEDNGRGSQNATNPWGPRLDRTLIDTLLETIKQQKQTIENQANRIKHLEDLVANCTHETPMEVTQVRLVGGNSTAGRVEVLHHGLWRSICDDRWDDKDAAVVCRMLDLRGGTALKGSTPLFGRTYSKSSFWLDDLECEGDETDIALCPHAGWAVEDCDPSEAAKIVCSNTVSTPVRLVGGNSTSGRVEVQHQGEWRSVCDDSWDSNDAIVVCRMLGLGGGTALSGSDRRFGRPHAGLFWLDNLNCCGSETDIALCSHVGWGYNDCNSGEAAKLICSTTKEAEGPTWVRLAGGNRTAGRVEVQHLGIWKPICNDGWDDRDAGVVCRMLGFQGGTVPRGRRSLFWGSYGSCYWLDDIKCNGNESDIASCDHNGWGVEDCDKGKNAEVICSQSVNTQLRLVGGNTTAGRVEVYHQGEWRGICDNNWSDSDAKVVCRMLGFSHETTLQGGDNRFGQLNSSSAWLDNVHCGGCEDDIALCSYKGWGVQCDRDHAAKVICTNNTGSTVLPTMVKLQGGNQTAGRVVVYHDKEWKGICDDNWDDSDARVVCRMLGLSGGKALKGSHRQFGRQYSDCFWLDDLQCNGNETDVALCHHNGWGMDNCKKEQAAKIICSEEVTTPVKLVGSNSTSGRVEVMHLGEWRSICSNGWGSSDSKVICRMLRSRSDTTGGQVGNISDTSLAQEVNNSAIHPWQIGLSSYWLNGVQCTGCERDIALCTHSGWGAECSSFSEAVQVTCNSYDAVTVSTAVRLIGGSESSGRVQVYHKGEWRGVCDDSWDNKDAKVICRMLGLGGGSAYGGGFERFGQPDKASFWLDDVNCCGDETDIAQCGHNGWGSHNCGQSEAAKVICSNTGTPNLPFGGHTTRPAQRFHMTHQPSNMTTESIMTTT